jgi:hypothetical protein
VELTIDFLEDFLEFEFNPIHTDGLPFFKYLRVKWNARAMLLPSPSPNAKIALFGPEGDMIR